MYRDYKPKFKNCFRLETERTEGVFLLSERNAALLSDPIYAQLAPLLDGNHSIDEIVNQLQDRLPTSYIYYGLNQLKNQGYLSNGDELLSPSLQIFCHQLNISFADARDRLQTTKVAVRAIGSMDAAELIKTLESHQIRSARMPIWRSFCAMITCNSI
jgi:ribosomal protein S12 methylthiotransferase accessory factor